MPKLTPLNDALVAVLEADGQLIFQMNPGMRVFPSIQMLQNILMLVMQKEIYIKLLTTITLTLKVPIHISEEG